MPHKLLTLKTDVLQFVSSLSENGVEEAGISAAVEGGTRDVILRSEHQSLRNGTSCKQMTSC